MPNLYPIHLNSRNCYEIKIYDQLDQSWLGWFGGANIHVETFADGSQITTLSDVVMDQAALVGLIRQLHGHGIVLISIVGRSADERVESKEKQND